MPSGELQRALQRHLDFALVAPMESETPCGRVGTLGVQEQDAQLSGRIFSQPTLVAALVTGHDAVVRGSEQQEGVLSITNDLLGNGCIIVRPRCRQVLRYGGREIAQSVVEIDLEPILVGLARTSSGLQPATQVA